MRILNVIPYAPVPAVFGGALRVFHLLRWMSTHHDVHVLSYGTPADRERMASAFGLSPDRITMVPDPFWLTDPWKRAGQLYALLRNTSFTEIASRNRDMQQALDRAFARSSYDIVQIAYPVMGYFTFRTDAIRVLDAANVEYDIHRRSAEASRSLLRRFWSSYEARKLRPQEIAICGEQDMIFIPSQRDKELLARDVPHVPTVVIPNGVDTAYFTPHDGPVDDDTLVFTGAINYFPNADAVTYFVSEVLPLIHKVRPHVRFSIVGNAPPDSVRRLASSHVEVTGFVDDVRPAIQRSAVYVVPLRIGGGTRLKVLEAMAMRKPIVTTPVGCEGIDVTDGDSVMIATTAQDFADATLQLLSDRRRAQALAAAGYELVHARYDWSMIGEAMGEAYGRLRARFAVPEEATS